MKTPEGRWNSDKGTYEQTPEADTFIEDVLEVCRKHDFCIGHEDGHGAFIIVKSKNKELYENWFRDAHYEEDEQ